MQARIMSIKDREVVNSAGTKFVYTDVTIAVPEDEEKRTVRPMVCSRPKESLEKYFEFCGVDRKEAVGREVSYTIKTREYETKTGAIRYTKYIAWFNLIDEEGAPIRMPKQEG